MRAISVFALFVFLVLTAGPSLADSGPPAAGSAATSATISGLVLDANNALPIVGADVVLHQGNVTVLQTTTDANGRYSFTAAPGLYRVTIRAKGYGVSETSDVAVLAGTATELNATLRASVSNTQSSLTTIGRTTTSARTLSAATTISRQITGAAVTDIGQIRVGDQIGTLPGVNFSTSSSVGDDASIDLRGFGSDETAALLDGHPVGPLGVGSGGFNFSLGPAYGLSEIDVTYGSGAQGLFGSDTIGGAVNFVTIDPTATPHYSLQQQIGGFGTLGTGLTATGTLDKVGYAFALGRLGEYGDFYPHVVAQSARPNNVSGDSVHPSGACAGGTKVVPAFPDAFDVSACNLGVNTYNVSQNTEQSVGLAKIDYALSPVTHFKVTTYGAVQWSDSTGNGDNDFLPYATRLAQIQSGPSNCKTGANAAGYQVVTNPLAGTVACYSAAQFALATSGPDGGGQDRQRSTTMRDYNFAFTTKVGPTDLTVSAFDNNYQFWKDSSLAGGTTASGDGLGTPTYANYYNTQGYLVSDELTTGRNYAGFGYTLYHQLQDGNENDSLPVLRPHHSDRLLR